MTNTTKNHNGNCGCYTCVRTFGPPVTESPEGGLVMVTGNVPRGAEFQFGWNGHDFFTTTDGVLIATPKS